MVTTYTAAISPLIRNSLVPSLAIKELAIKSLCPLHYCAIEKNCHSCVPGIFSANKLISCSGGRKNVPTLIGYLTTQVVFSNINNMFWVKAIAKMPATNGTVCCLQLEVLYISKELVIKVLTQQRSQIRNTVTCVSTGSGLSEVEETKTQTRPTGWSRDEHGHRWKPAKDPSPFFFGWSLWHKLRDTHSIRSKKGRNPSDQCTLTSLSLGHGSKHVPFRGFLWHDKKQHFHHAIQSVISTAWHWQKTSVSHEGIAFPIAAFLMERENFQFMTSYTGNDDSYLLLLMWVMYL